MPVRDIRVQDRGSFFDDSFFKDSWDDFDTAMQRVLDRFDGHGMKVNSKSRPHCQDVYRKIRTNRIDEDMYASQAFQVTENDGRFQVVVDVKDFNPTDLQVKVIEEKVVLEGRYDKVSEDGKSSSSKAFYREFMLPPEADIDLISTALSKDGILTIRAPRKKDTAAAYDQKASASQYIQNTLNERFGSGPKSFDNSKPFLQNPCSYGTQEGFDSLPRNLKDRLIFSDRDSGRGSTSSSPCPSVFSNTYNSSTPSETGLETSKILPGMENDTGRKGSFQSPQIDRQNVPNLNTSQGYSPSERISSPQGDYQYNQPEMNVSRAQPKKSCAAVGSGGTASITVKEEDGKRTLTSEKSSLVQQKDGFLESKEVAAEVTEKDSQAARREAITRMMKTDEDPEGRFRKSEAADASDVSETCVQHLPDGSVVTVKKSSTSTSNIKQSYSTGVPSQGIFNSNFPSGFGDMHNLVGRGHSLMSQMSSDSLSSNMSNFSDLSSFSRFSDMSNFSDMSSGFSPRTPFQDRFSNFPNFPSFTSMNQNQQMTQNQQMPYSQPSQSTRTSYSSTTQNTYSSNFDTKY